MPNFVVNRSGMPPLAFLGEIIGQSDMQFAEDGQRRPRWHGIAIYEVENGKFYVVHIDYHSTFRNEIGFSEAHVCSSLNCVAYVLDQHDPTSHVQGWPNVEQYAGRQRHLLASIRKLYANVVSKVLSNERFTVSPQTCVKLCFDPDHSKLLDVCRSMVTSPRLWGSEQERDRLFEEMSAIVAKIT